VAATTSIMTAWHAALSTALLLLLQQQQQQRRPSLASLPTHTHLLSTNRIDDNGTTVDRKAYYLSLVVIMVLVE